MSLTRKVRLGFIGAGWWATSNHMPLLAARDDVELVAVCRLGRNELKQVQERFGFGFATEDYRELLARSDLDGVVVSSPHTLHYEHARAALERGLHLMCEKPMTTRASEARQLVRLAKEKGRHLLVPYGWHYKPFIQQAKKLLDQGSVGTIEHVLCHMASPIRKLLAGEGMNVDSVSGQSAGSLFQPDPATWADPAVAGGGYGHAQISHSSGMLFWLTGLAAESVYALMSAPGARVDLYDTLSVRFAGGAIGAFSGAGTVPANGAFQVDLRIFGDQGMLLLDCERARLELRREDGRHFMADLDPKSGLYDNFVELIAGRTNTNWAPGDVAMRSVELLDAAYRSAASGNVEAVKSV
jgi:predicted dehydrogenase